MREITKIYIHCSYSTWGSFEDVDRWHKERGFDPAFSLLWKRNVYCGYHYIVLNPYTTSKVVSDRLFRSFTDGQIIEARPVSAVGCHVKGDNQYSIGVCYIGVSPSVMQYHSLITLSKKLMGMYNIPVKNVFGHYEFYTVRGEKPLKTCPNFYMPAFRECLERG